MSKRPPILIGFFTVVTAIWLQLTPVPAIRHVITRLENFIYDIELRGNLTQAHKLVDSPVVIVDIDDLSLLKEGRWPWSRFKSAQLVDSLVKQGAAVIAFDILFAEPQDNVVDIITHKLIQQNLTQPFINDYLTRYRHLFDADLALADSFRAADVVLGLTFLPQPATQWHLPTPLMTLDSAVKQHFPLIQSPGYIANIPLLQAAAKHAGLINIFPDEDGVIRRLPLLMRYQDKVYPALALEAVRLYLLSSVQLITARYHDRSVIEGVKLAEISIPTDQKAQLLLPFFGSSYSLPYFSATKVLHNQIPHGALQGKIVFVGTSAVGLGDLHPTPVEAVFPGIEIQTTAASAILAKKFYFYPAWALGVEVSLTVVLGSILVLLLPRLGPLMLSALLVVVPLLLILLNHLVREKTGIVFSVLMPCLLPIVLVLINVIYGYFFKSKRREKLKKMFGQYVPDTHIEEMLSSKEGYGLQGEDREMTVIFADIRNFTSISEQLVASDLKNLLNEFFTPMTQIIFDHQGTIDKYVGDMIMAFWGAPLKDPKHAEHALAAALAMQRAVTEVQAHFTARNLAKIEIGIGLNTGIMSVGDMGSKFRRNYTVLGDPVNLASRVESLTKYYGVKIIATEHTSHQQSKFVFRFLDKVKVKGKQASVTLLELICYQHELTNELKNELTLWQQGLEAYFAQRWTTAYSLFAQLIKTYPQTKLYQLYLERTDYFINNSPGSEWEGVYIHQSK